MDRLVGKHEASWTSHRAADLETALAKLAELPIDVVLLGAGTDTAEREVLEAAIAKVAGTTKIVAHYGGGSGLLYAEIHQALAATS